MSHGTVRITNTHNGPAHELTDPIAIDIEFDGQKYTIGPNEKKVIYTAGLANVSLAVSIDVDDATASKRYPDTDAIT